MAITRAQQVRQMLEDGGMLVSPSKDGKRPGYRSAAVQAADANELHVIASILQIQPREVTT